MADAALREGTAREAFSGNMRRYLDRLFHSHGPTFIKVYHGNVYVFGSGEGPLITAFSLPGNLKHTKAGRES